MMRAFGTMFPYRDFGSEIGKSQLQTTMEYSSKSGMKQCTAARAQALNHLQKNENDNTIFY